MRLPSGPRSLLLAVAAAALLAQGARAADRAASQAPDVPPAWQPRAMTFPGNRITLLEAVRTTLENDPAIRLSAESSRGQRGLFQIQSGQFDPLVQGSAAYNLTQQHLLLSQLQAERKKRTDLEKDLATAAQAADLAQPDLQRAVTQLQFLNANPNTYQVSTDGFLSLQRAAALQSLQREVTQLNQQIAAETNPFKRELLTTERNAKIQGALIENQQELLHNRDNQNEIQQSLTNLGAVPETEVQQNVALDIQLLVPTRTGVTFGLFANGGWERDRYKGKDKLEEFGGLGVEDLYHYEVGFSLDAQLLRGRGFEATGAFEQSARIDWEASRYVLQHSVSTSVLNTVLAYWNLVAAQEFLETAKASTTLHTRRVEVTKGLIEGDEIPRAELPRELASQANDEALVMSSERQVAEARVTLARAMGLSVVDDANAPYAADPFPSVNAAIANLSPAELIATAHDRRFDRLAALRLVESGGVLARQALTELRPRLDFTSQISANTQAETSLAKTANGWAAPSFQVGLNFEKPIGNNVARGLVVQTSADVAARSISAADITRNMDASIVQVLYSMRATADQLGRIGESVRLYGETIESQNEMFRAGQTSLLDSILTQDLQTSARFTFTQAKFQWASLLARLRFETGTLVAETTEGNGRVRAEDLVTIPSGARAK
jgi:outer membrane protein TolC